MAYKNNFEDELIKLLNKHAEDGIELGEAIGILEVVKHNTLMMEFEDNENT